MITGKNTNRKGGAEMTDYTKDQFISELAIFATAWVDEKMIPVMERADELWENEFARVIVKYHAKFKLAVDVARKNMALAIADGDKLSYETQKMIYEYNSEKRNAFRAVLHDVLMNNGQ